jgi:hypothetical protein
MGLVNNYANLISKRLFSNVTGSGVFDLWRDVFSKPDGRF